MDGGATAAERLFQLRGRSCAFIATEQCVAQVPQSDRAETIDVRPTMLVDPAGTIALDAGVTGWGDHDRSVQRTADAS